MGIVSQRYGYQLLKIWLPAVFDRNKKPARLLWRVLIFVL